MKLKQFIFTLFVGITLFNHTMFSAMGAGPAAGQSFDDFFFDTISKMTPEELDELARAGEQIAKEMEAQGIDVDKFIEDQLKELSQPMPDQKQPAFQPKPAEPMPSTSGYEPRPTPSEPSEMTNIKLPIVDQTRQESIDAALATISEKLPEVIRYAKKDRVHNDLIAPWEEKLNDLLYYAYVAKQVKLLKYLSTKEFERLYDTIIGFSSVLQKYEPLLISRDDTQEDPYVVLGVSKTASPDEIEQAYMRHIRKHNPERAKMKIEAENLDPDAQQRALEKADARFKAIEQAYYDIGNLEKSDQAFKQILSSFLRYVDQIIGGAQELLKKYEPEALATKEAQEKRMREAAALAKESREKSAPYAPTVYSFDYPSAYGTPSSSSYGRPYASGGQGQGWTGGQIPQAGTPTPSGQQPSGPSRGGGQRPPAPGEKKSDDKKSDSKPSSGKPGESKEDTKKNALQASIKSSIRIEIMDKIEEYLKEKPDQKNERYKLFKDFTSVYLQDSKITPPYDVTNASPDVIAELIKAEQINETLKKLTKQIKKITDDIKTDYATLKGAKPAYKKAIEERFKKLDADYFKKYMPDIITLKIDPIKKTIMTASGTSLETKIKPEKLFIHFGLNNFKTPDINDPFNAPIKRLNTPDSDGRAANVINDFITAYKKLNDTIQEKKK